jgi:uncharacterized protein YdhG (YjbR/CyaY superfamily)
MRKPENTSAYIASFPLKTRKMLTQIRKAVKEAAPGAEEVISYGMPALKMKGVLVYYAAYEHHIGFYPTPSAIKKFKKELKDYNTSKGTVQFPLDEPLPLELIQALTRYRVSQDGVKKKPAKTAKK